MEDPKAASHFTPEGHLSELAYAKVADSIAMDRLQDLPVELRKHLDECSACRHEVAELYQVVQSLDEKPLPTQKSQSKGMNKYMIWVPIVLLFSGLAYWFWPASNEPSPRPKLEQNAARSTPPISTDTIVPKKIEAETKPEPQPLKQNTPPPEKEEAPVYADAFIPDDQLESLVGIQVRSGEELRFVPDPGKTVKRGGPLSFSWTNSLEGPFELTVLNNEGEEQKRYEGFAHNWVFRVDLSPGLYYWKLETVEDLLFVGKFTILGVREE